MFVPNGSFGRPVRARDFARQTRRLGHEVNQPYRMASLLGQRDVVAEPVLQAIEKTQLTVKDLLARTSPQNTLLMEPTRNIVSPSRIFVPTVGDVSETGEGHLAVAH